MQGCLEKHLLKTQLACIRRKSSLPQWIQRRSCSEPDPVFPILICINDVAERPKSLRVLRALPPPAHSHADFPAPLHKVSTVHQPRRQHISTKVPYTSLQSSWIKRKYRKRGQNSSTKKEQSKHIDHTRYTLIYLRVYRVSFSRRASSCCPSQDKNAAHEFMDY